MQRALLLLLFAASYLLFAGATTWALHVLLGVAAAAAFAAPARTFRFPASMRLLDVFLIALLAATAFQLIPMPASVIAVLSPHAGAITDAIHLTPPGTPPPSMRALSVDPSLTVTVLETIALGTLTFWTARGVFAAGGGTRLSLKVLTFFGTLAATLAVIQKAVSPRSVLFVLTPDSRSANPFGAFVNRNHFAMWLLMVAGPVAGYAIARMHAHPLQGRRWRPSIGQVLGSGAVFTMIGVLLMIGVSLLTLSRSAVAALASAALVAWRLGSPRLRVERSSFPAILGTVGAMLLVVFFFVDVDRWAERLQQSLDTSQSGFSRMTIWRESLPVIKDFWVTGTGAGTYSDAMTVYQQTRLWVGSMQNWAHFNNAHSLYVQIASEGGLLLGIPALLIFLTLVTLGQRAVRADKGEMFWVRTGAAGALAGLAVQSIWEVALMMPANAVMAGILAALLLYQRDASSPRQDWPRSKRLDDAPAIPVRMAR